VIKSFNNLLSKKQPAVQHSISQPPADRPLTDFEIAERVNQIISGGRLRK